METPGEVTGRSFAGAGGMRACPAGNGKGACACVQQVTNIRLLAVAPRGHRRDAWTKVGTDIMATARTAAVYPPVPEHLRHLLVGDPFPLPRPRPARPVARPADVGEPERDAVDTPATPPDEETLARIYRDETPGLLRFLRRRLGGAEEANDLAHDTMARFLKAAPSTPIATPQAYLRRIATNLLRDRAERGSTRLAMVSVPLLDDIDTPADDDQHRALEGREEWERWTSVLRCLPAITLEVFLLSRVDGFTYQEIAEHLDISVWSVKRRMTKAIAHLDQNRSGAR